MPAEEHAEQGDDLGEPAAQMADHRLGQPDHALRDVGRGHQFTADQQEEGDGERRLQIDAVEHHNRPSTAG